MDLDKILDRLGRMLDAMVAKPAASSDDPHTEYVLPVWAETAVLFTVSLSGAVFLCLVGCLTLTDAGRQHLQKSTARYEQRVERQRGKGEACLRRYKNDPVRASTVCGDQIANMRYWRGEN
jgi:hypothetical protein